MKVLNLFMFLFWILIAVIMAVAFVISEAAHLIVSALKYLFEEIFYILFPESKIYKQALRNHKNNPLYNCDDDETEQGVHRYAKV